MFGSTFEIVGILGGLLAIVAAVASLFVNPMITVGVFVTLAAANLVIVLILCEPFGKRRTHETS